MWKMREIFLASSEYLNFICLFKKLNATDCQACSVLPASRDDFERKFPYPIQSKGQ